MHLSLVAETLFHIGSFPVTNSILTTWIVVTLLSGFSIYIGTHFRRLPQGIQHVFEMVYQMFDNMAHDLVGETGRKYVPLVVTLFLFIITSNWLGVLPGVGSLGFYREVHGETEFIPLLRGANADLNTTLALALISVVMTNIFGLRASGLLGHLKHFINPLEIVSEFSKILSFAFRLFGNVFAGEVLLLAGATILVMLTKQNNLLFGIPGGLIQAPFLMLEVFVGFIQAFIFAVLTLSFISGFVKSHAAH
jgi:F-type H+-transporting ATPase subunit a